PAKLRTLERERAAGDPAALLASLQVMLALSSRSGPPRAHLVFGGRRIGSRGGRIVLVKLDVAAAAGRSGGTQFARRKVVSIRPEPKPVAAAGFAVVLHPDPEPHGKAAGPAVDHAFPADIARVGKRWVHEVPRDVRASQVSGRVEAMVENVHMPPERAILASAVSAEVDLGTRVADYPPAAGDEVAGSRNEVRIGRTGREHS